MSSPENPVPYPPSGSPPPPYSGVGGYGGYPNVVQVDDSSPITDQVVFIVVVLLTAIALAFATAAVWAGVADPPEAVVAQGGAFLTGGEAAYNQRVVETLWFMAIGAGIGVVFGFVVALVGRRHGTTVVVAVLLAAAVAALLSGWVGIHWFGPDMDAAIADAKAGDTITSGLDISTKVAYLGWPIGALLGAVLGIALWPKDRIQPTWPAPSTTVYGYDTSARGQ